MKNSLVKTVAAFSLTALVAGAGNALAGEAKQEMLESEAKFVSLDADKNGALSKEEASADSALAEAFASADADQDGQISKQEFVLYSGDATAAGS
ncbi:hypothetical protein BTA51_06160 [Hahella sp. CCB-MM4]|uniref:EF-hand domain-containing protein n=1 Tax=Hahella sp. (strain CCB-MM4) TaxID=1926491 RepID=UPI000B9B549D|nr:EF-hand domain-containing protein [Hahella sp. CCB-MM4]OZG74579.1 hypothetical protein BTA51_06160 [Hahella sp. CCB-MM4]